VDEVDNYCDACGEHFDNSFEYVDHFFEENKMDEFDPVLVLPNGVRLMVGSLLRFLFDQADNPEEIRQITQSTYVTLFAAETTSPAFEELIEDVVVQNEMLRFDDSLKQLLEEKNPDDNESGA
jgi:hypothetical protein